MNAVSLGRDEAGAFARRLAQRREALGLRKQDLAKKMGLSLTTIQQYERGQWPRGGHAVRLARTLGCSLDWLLAGKGEAEGGVLDTPDARLVMVPMVEARLSAGTGSFETSDEVLRHYAFRWDFLRRKGNPSRMVLLRVSGDSMQPRIMHNDVVLIDQSQNVPVPGRIYAVGVEDMVYLKIVNAVPGRLILSSSNALYAPIEAPTGGQLADLVRVIGRAVWVGRELD
ncbi:helix-turn-helix transcriptional regulator [Desulfovibrio legallii]|jgi:phage repressor protein C with HTH and peptisase S24 domain|uniref:Helix-turn-helix transcriptional regulator n=1 Tax=Desulfovibrio legallii TaxID=571438 RepID=A0A6H3F821_9BACT|nr:helix-turn-helix transcriptional regulator [Desulfovibrio legallii]RHH23550.1 helix-turn-helix transcriptional regulator [Desulfovibrio sp. AM18-2]TBH79459.1 helix-turn-helix transcriptional regulator [Desulfovibrio legallii]CAI3240199.1 Transcriptional regulator [Desulfovibrio diazotrophicus]